MAISEIESVLLIGASRGLGLAIAQEYIARGSKVVATVRGDAPSPLRELSDRADGRLEIEHLDITEPTQLASLRQRLAARSFDLLFVVAGTTNAREATPVDVDTEEFARVMITNALSPLRAIEALGDLVSPNGTIAIMSSGQGASRATRRGTSRSIAPASRP